VRIALLGGSFNPPHVGHLLAAHFVRATWPVDEVWLMPAHRHPFGKPLEAFAHRVGMCERLCADTSGWLRVSQVEAEVPGDGRTVDTLEYLHRHSPEHQWVLVIGSDILADLPHWKDFPRVEALAQVLVLHRAGYPSPRAFGPPLAQVSSTEVRERLAQGEHPHHLVPRAVLDYALSHRLFGLGR
jgi:nicotinate-nucleotide adenylyltransferase